MGSGTPARRIAVAIALSALVHAAIMWLPRAPLPHAEKLFPPLAAKLEPLPKLAAKPFPKPVPKPERAKPPEPPIEPAATVAETESSIADIPEQVPTPVIEAASAVEIVPAVAQAPAVEILPAIAAPAVEAQPAAIEEKSKAEYPLPNHVQLTFSVYKGLDHFQIGTLNQQLEIGGGKYILRALTQTVGLAKLFKNYQLTQTSRGKSGKQGLQPEIFEEEKINDSDKQNIKATFDWQSQKLIFSKGGETALPTGAQDMLSIFYQLSQIPLNKETIQLAVSNGKKLEKYEFGIGPEEEITTQLGKLRTLHLRKLRAKGESGIEIWLGLEYRLLPVKYMLIEPSDDVAGEIVVTDIRIAE